jgi:hypothetical protein
VSFFRPTRKVTDPKGREWEIYVSRYSTPAWQPNDYDSFADDPMFGRLMILGLLLEIPLFLYHSVLVPIVRFLVVTPYRFLRGRGSRTIWIEAISWGVAPRKDTIVWTTTPDHLVRVLDQIASGLAEGDVPQPLGGAFQGRATT